jgi:phosphatidylserine/phosphatidylglycerophosphate/cardiolipin synthase-like enzyme
MLKVNSSLYGLVNRQTIDDQVNRKTGSWIRCSNCLLDHKFNKIEFPIDYGSKIENLRNYWADLKTFQDKNGKLNIVPTHLGFIHHKFAIIDKKISITGSYNWSINASKNKENIVVIDDTNIAKKFNKHLDEIINTNMDDIISSNFQSVSS